MLLFAIIVFLVVGHSLAATKTSEINGSFKDYASKSKLQVTSRNVLSVSNGETVSEVEIPEESLLEKFCDLDIYSIAPRCDGYMAAERPSSFTPESVFPIGVGFNKGLREKTVCELPLPFMAYNAEGRCCWKVDDESVFPGICPKVMGDKAKKPPAGFSLVKTSSFSDDENKDGAPQSNKPSTGPDSEAARLARKVISSPEFRNARLVERFVFFISAPETDASTKEVASSSAVQWRMAVAVVLVFALSALCMYIYQRFEEDQIIFDGKMRAEHYHEHGFITPLSTLPEEPAVVYPTRFEADTSSAPLDSARPSIESGPSQVTSPLIASLAESISFDPNSTR